MYERIHQLPLRPNLQFLPQLFCGQKPLEGCTAPPRPHVELVLFQQSELKETQVRMAHKSAHCLSHDVFKAANAATGESLVFAAATQFLPMGPP